MSAPKIKLVAAPPEPEKPVKAKAKAPRPTRKARYSYRRFMRAPRLTEACLARVEPEETDVMITSTDRHDFVDGQWIRRESRS